MHVNNYTMGRGKVYLAREAAFDAFDTVGERYVGNSPGFTLGIESQSLDHFSSEGGINELDASVTTQVNRSGTLTLDDISMDNLALFFLGSTSAVTQTATPVVGETIADVQRGMYYQLGASLTNPQGVRNVTAVTVSAGASTLVLNTDYELDAETGRIYVMPGATFTGTSLTVGYTPGAGVRTRAISGSQSIRGRLRFVEDNPAGDNRTFLLPLVEITPNGDFDLKGDGWRQMPFNIKALKRGSMEAIWIDGVPQTA